MAKTPKKVPRVPRVPTVPRVPKVKPVPKVPTVPKVPKVARPDMNTLAARIVAEATGRAPKTPNPDAGKDPAAVALGRKGGKARAKKMNKKQRAASAKKAAQARWESQKVG